MSPDADYIVVRPCTTAIIAWADNTWEYLEDYSPEDWTHMSEDYAIMYLPAGADEDQIEEYVRAFNRGEGKTWTAS